MNKKLLILFLIANNFLNLGEECNCCDCCEKCCGEKEEKKNEDKGNEDKGNEEKNVETKIIILKSIIPEDFVQKSWLKKKKEKSKEPVLKLFTKTENDNKYKSKDEDITIELEKDEGKTVIKDLNNVKDTLKTATGKWALFEIKTVNNEIYYLYCSDIESELVDYSQGIFESQKDFLSISVLACNTSSVIDMSHMFSFCSKLVDLNISNFNTQNVTNMNAMFSCCYSLKTLDISNFNTEKCTSMSNMFRECNNLTKLDLSCSNISFNQEALELYDYLGEDFLDDSYSLQLIYFKDKQIAETFIKKYCNIYIRFNAKKPERKYEYYYDEEKKFHCVKVTKTE